MCTYISVSEYLNSAYAGALGNCDNVTGSLLTDFVSGLIDVAQSLVDNYIGRTFCPQTYEEIFTGDDSTTYFTDNKNILGISGITFLDVRNYASFNSNNVLTGTLNPTDYKISDSKLGLIRMLSNYNNGLLHMRRGFSRDYEYSLIYRAGYETIPNDVKTAMYILVTSLSLAIDTGQISIPDGGTVDLLKLDKMSANYGNGKLNKTVLLRDMNELNNLPVTVYQILNRYKGK